MEQEKFSLNRGTFCGELVALPEFDHAIKDKETGEVLKEFYLMEIEVTFENKNKTVTDTSKLPYLINKEQLESLGELKLGDLLSVQGRWRMFTRFENGKRTVVPRIAVSRLEKVDEYADPRDRNRVEFHGYLRSKLYKVEFDDEGNLVKDENGKPKAVLDEEGNRIPWTRKNREKHTVNDIILKVKSEVIVDGKIKVLYEDYIPAIGYGVVARQISDEIDIGAKVLARGYIRRREKYGHEGEYVYEAVVTRVTPVDDKKEKVDKEASESNEQENSEE